jgi:predicted RNase H-like HicB family nuclease
MEAIIMNSNYTAVIKKDGDYWIGWIEEITGVNCQEKTKSELFKSLKVTLREALEFNRHDAIASAQSDYEEELLCV